MSTERLEQLRAMLAEEPGDEFIRYAIALELKRAGRMEEAIDAIKAILTTTPSYVPGYYQLALMQADMGLNKDAIATCEAGALQSLVTGDRKARAELVELKGSLLDEL